MMCIASNLAGQTPRVGVWPVSCVIVLLATSMLSATIGCQLLVGITIINFKATAGY